MPVCKVVEVLQDFLSEYVDKKFTRDYNVILYLSIFNSFRVMPNYRSMYPSIFNSFPVIRTGIAKKSPFSRTAADIFVSPGDAPAIITQYVAWMERQFNTCQTPRIMYLSIFNSFRVIRCLTQCVSPKIAIFTTFLFPLETPLRLSQCLPNRLQHVSIYLQQFPSYSNRNCQKSPFSRTAAHIFRFPWRRPCDYHAICCTDGKTIQCWPNPSRHVPMYLQ